MGDEELDEAITHSRDYVSLSGIERDVLFTGDFLLKDVTESSSLSSLILTSRWSCLPFAVLTFHLYKGSDTTADRTVNKELEFSRRTLVVALAAEVKTPSVPIGP